MDMKMFGVPYKITNKVVEFEQDRRIAWRHFGAHRWRYELVATDDGGTQVTETWDATRYAAPVFAGLRGPRLPGQNQAGITGTLVRLKQAAEADLAATPDAHPSVVQHRHACRAARVTGQRGWRAVRAIVTATATSPTPTSSSATGAASDPGNQVPTAGGSTRNAATAPTPSSSRSRRPGPARPPRRW